MIEIATRENAREKLVKRAIRSQEKKSTAEQIINKVKRDARLGPAPAWPEGKGGAEAYVAACGERSGGGRLA